MKSKRPPTEAEPSHQWVEKHGCRPPTLNSALIADKASFLYRLLEFGQNKKVPLSLPRSDINCEIVYDDTNNVNKVILDNQSENVNQSVFSLGESNTPPGELIEVETMVNIAPNDELVQKINDKSVQNDDEVAEEPGETPAVGCPAEDRGENREVDGDEHTVDLGADNGVLLREHKVKHMDERVDSKTVRSESKRSSGFRDSPPRKVSFKVRTSATSTLSRRAKLMESRVTLTSNTVAALTTKFNALISDNDVSKHDKLTRTDTDCKAVLMIPQQKKQTEIKVILTRKNSYGKKDVSLTTVNGAGIRRSPSQVEDNCRSLTKDAKRKISITYRPSILGPRSVNVKAAIQIFEQNAATVIKSKPDEVEAVDVDDSNKVYCSPLSPTKTKVDSHTSKFGRSSHLNSDQSKPVTKKKDNETYTAKIDERVGKSSHSKFPHKSISAHHHIQMKDREERGSHSKLEHDERSSRSKLKHDERSSRSKLEHDERSSHSKLEHNGLPVSAEDNELQPTETENYENSRHSKLKEKRCPENVIVNELHSTNREDNVGSVLQPRLEQNKSLLSTEDDEVQPAEAEESVEKCFSSELQHIRLAEDLEPQRAENRDSASNRTVNQMESRYLSSSRARSDFLKVIVAESSECKVDRNPGRDKVLPSFQNIDLNSLQPDNTKETHKGVFKTKELTMGSWLYGECRTDALYSGDDKHAEIAKVECNNTIAGVDAAVRNVSVITLNGDNSIKVEQAEDKTTVVRDLTNETDDVVASTLEEEQIAGKGCIQDVVDTESHPEDKVAVPLRNVLNQESVLEDEQDEGHYKELVDTMKPNSSFLFRTSTGQLPPNHPPPLPPKKPQIVPVELSRPSRAAPPPPPPKTEVPPPPPKTEVPLPPPKTEVPPPQEDIYDDIHPPSSAYGSAQSHSYSTVEDDGDYDDISEQQPQQEQPEDMYELCGAPTYDDCEGEGYQCIGDQVEEDDIYDDVKSMTTLRTSDETTSISNCYESIYGGERSPRHVPKRYNGSSASSSSRGGNSSSCDQSNSLYGVGGSLSQASTVSADDTPHEVTSYQLTTYLAPRSETSDEWMDVELSESEHEQGQSRHTIVVVQEQPRVRRSASWSRKVRKQWSKSPRKQSGNNTESGENSSDSDDHHYEMLEEVIGTNINDVNPYDDFDSFDSDDSEMTAMKPSTQEYLLEPRHRQLPEPPPGQNIYGITKIAEAAGKKMLKLRKSLSRIRPKRNDSTREVHLTVSPPAVPTSPRPQPPVQQPPPPPSPILKASSVSNLSNRKYWTLSKFKRSMSITSGVQPALTSPKTSTFYLTDPVDVDTELVENGSPSRQSSVSDCPSENGTVPTSPSITSSTKTLAWDSSVESESGRRIPKTTSTPDRRNSGTVRPNSPPPLPPVPPDVPKRPNRKEKRVSNTSWYTEWGLFDRTEAQNSSSSDSSKKPQLPPKLEKPPSNCWYAEVGLWDTTGTSSPNDSSLSLSEHDTGHQTDVSDSSVSQENSGVPQMRFRDEPLYQFYTASVLEKTQWGMNSEFDSDGYEEIGDRALKAPVRPTAMELIQPREGQHRTLWCEIPEVVNSRVLSTLSIHQKKLQEAKFEIITSEASYINSLNVLEHHFMASPELNDEVVISKNDRRILFGNVIPVKSCSEKFLAELEDCWQDNILLHGICDAIYKYATNHFSIYIKYCSNQIYLDRTLRRLKDQHGRFADVLTQLEANPSCQLLSLHSFLMLPMQRITRLPLLIDAVLTRLNPQDEEHPTCELALATLNKIVQDCNEGARRMERMEEILILSRQLDFPREVRAVPIISSSRWLVKSGELTQLVWRGDDAKLTFGKKFSKASLHIFLFTDLLVITKKKSEECYSVVDHCPRNLVQMMSAEGMSHLPVKLTADGGRNLLLLTMLQNHEKKTVEMILSCALESDRQRWLEAVSQPTSDNPEETVYEEWDCPQVTAVHSYTASQPDELSLDVSDVVNVLRKMTDGWYQGERMRDGERGWFPGNYTVEIASAHVRARNLKQRYRLLALSANFLDSQRKEKFAK